MNSFLSPLLILILFLIGIVVFNNRASKKPLTVQNFKWIFIGYIFILVIGLAFSPLLPTSEAKEPGNDFNAYRNNWDDSLYVKLMEGNFSDINEENIKNKWELSYTNDSVFIDFRNFDGLVLVEKTSELEDEMEVFFIKDWEVMEVGSTLIDISDYTPNMTVELESNVLLLKGPGEMPEISLAYTEPEFTIKQFKNSKYESGFGYGYTGSHFFYMRVPEELHVSYSDFIIVEFVEN